MDVGVKVLMISLEFNMISHYVTVTHCVALCSPKSVLSSDF